MGIFDKEILIIKSIENEINNTIISTVKKYDFVLIDFITEKQHLQLGQDGKGKEIGYYSSVYSRIRIKKRLQVEYVDLKFTGDFHAGIEIFAGANEFKVISNIEYADDIIKRYGVEVLEIQKRFLAEFVDNYLKPELKKMINDKLTRSIN